MKVRRFIVILIILLVYASYLHAQPGPDDPPDGGGTELDGVPIAGGIIYFIVSLIVGGVSTFIKRKKDYK